MGEGRGRGAQGVPALGAKAAISADVYASFMKTHERICPSFSCGRDNGREGLHELLLDATSVASHEASWRRRAAPRRERVK